MTTPTQPTPKVSLGMPVYNAEAFLAEAIESILAQTWGDFELVIADNHSTDSTPAICKQYQQQDPRIRLIRRPQNQGAIDNFNFVFRNTHGDYFKWAAGDDLLAPTYLETMVQVLDSQPSVGWCHCKSDIIDSKGESWLTKLKDNDPLVVVVPGKKWWKGQPRPSYGHDSAVRRFQGVLLGTTWSVDSYGLIRRSLLNQTRMLIPVYGSEKVLLAEMSLYSKFDYVDENLFSQRVHTGASGAMTNRKDQQAFAKTGSTKKALSSRMALLFAHTESVRRSPLSVWQKCKAYFAILTYLIQVHKFLRLALEISGIRSRSDSSDMMSRAYENQSISMTSQASPHSPEEQA